MSKHADASPSSAHAWLHCPASVTRTRGMERKSTSYAREGTAAHTVAELLLTSKKVPKAIEVEGERIKVDADMLEALGIYVSYVGQRFRGADFKASEVRVSVPFLDEPIHGTSDAVAFSRKTKVLDVVDLKFGKGVLVSAINNPQLRIYGLGTLALLGPFEDVETIRLTIVQPRAEGFEEPQTEELSFDELMAWGEEVFEPAVKIIAEGAIWEQPGAWCRFCPRAHECEALANEASKQALVAWGEAPPLAEELNGSELARILDHAELIFSWVKKVRAEAYDRLEKGDDVPGYHLVPKRAMRHWLDEDEALATLTETLRIPWEEITKIDTPAAVERVMKRRKMRLDISSLYAKESSGSTIGRLGVREGVDAQADPRLAFQDVGFDEQ